VGSTFSGRHSPTSNLKAVANAKLNCSVPAHSAARIGWLRSGFYPLPSLQLGFVLLAEGHGIHDHGEHLFATYSGDWVVKMEHNGSID
jgi:hypothetical protein